MPQTTIRIADIQNAPAITRLLGALEIHYGGEASSPDETRAMIERSIGESEGTRYAVAFLQEKAVGLMCFAVLRPGFNLRGLVFLKELFVARDARGRTVGAAMMRWLAFYARARNLGRIDLTTDRANTGAGLL